MAQKTGLPSAIYVCCLTHAPTSRLRISSSINMHIGILGGTFDPIHYGHIRPAIEVQAQLGLDQVWLMPNHIPPHKAGTHTSTEDRLAMVGLVTEDYPQLALCAIDTSETVLHTVLKRWHNWSMNIHSTPLFLSWERTHSLTSTNGIVGSRCSIIVISPYVSAKAGNSHQTARWRSNLNNVK